MDEPKREWTVYTNDEGLPWAVFLNGHVDIRPLRSKAAHDEMVETLRDYGGCDWQEATDHLRGASIQHLWIRDTSGDGDCDDPERPWVFCAKDEPGAAAITGVKF